MKKSELKQIVKEEYNKMNLNEELPGHHYTKNGKWYVDSDFINLSKGALPNSDLKHAGFGEFYLKTADGDIQFDRSVGVQFKDQIGRSHEIYDDKNGKLVDKLIKKNGRVKAVKIS